MRHALVLVLCGALAACGDLPRPFQPTEKSPRAWAGSTVGTWGSILVRPVDGLPEPLSTALTDQIVEALLVREVPASTRFAGLGSIALVGRVSVVSGKLHWTLVAPGGEAVRRFEEPGPGRSWSTATPSDLAAVAARAAGRIVAALEPPAPVSAGAPTTARVFLEAVRGAPGDGGIALVRAMRQSLTRIGIAVADTRDETTLPIRGRVSIAPGESAPGGAMVAIEWEVRRPDGTTIGIVTQSNRESTDRLAGPWGPLAGAVAQAGAPGIVELLRHAGPLEAPSAPSVTVEAPIAPSVTAKTPLAFAAATEAPISVAATVGARLSSSGSVEAPISVSATAR